MLFNPKFPTLKVLLPCALMGLCSWCRTKWESYCLLSTLRSRSQLSVVDKRPGSLRFQICFLGPTSHVRTRPRSQQLRTRFTCHLEFGVSPSRSRKKVPGPQKRIIQITQNPQNSPTGNYFACFWGSGIRPSESHAGTHGGWRSLLGFRYHDMCLYTEVQKQKGGASREDIEI